MAEDGGRTGGKPGEDMVRLVGQGVRKSDIEKI